MAEKSIFDFVGLDEDAADDEVSSMSTANVDDVLLDEEDEEESESEEEEDDEDLKTVGEDDDDRRLEVLRLFLSNVKKMPELFDDEDFKAISKEIKRVETSKKRLWKKQCRERLKILSEYERVLRLQKFHPALSDFFVSKHRKMERMIASLK